MIKLKRAYEPAAPADGHRVLVERLWPRGVKKEELALDEWLKDVAPSPELRTWFAHDPERWPEFQRRYRAELRTSAAREKIAELARRASEGTVTFVFAASDPEHNSALLLKQEVERVLPKRSPRKKR